MSEYRNIPWGLDTAQSTDDSVSWEDWARAFGAGAVGLGSAAAGLTEYLTDDPLRKNQARFAREDMDRLAADILAGMGVPAQQALQADYLATGENSVWQQGPIRSTILKILNAAPSNAPSLLAGGVLGATTRSVLGGMLVGGVIEGGLEAGSTYGQMRSKLDQTPADVLAREDPAFARDFAMEGETKARERLTRRLSDSLTPLVTGLSAGTLGAISGGTAAKGAKGLLGGRLATAGREGLGEAATEGASSGISSYGMQSTLEPYTGEPVSAGQVAEDTVQGGVAGYGMGFGFGLLAPQRPDQQAQPGAIPVEDPAQLAPPVATGVATQPGAQPAAQAGAIPVPPPPQVDPAAAAALRSVFNPTMPMQRQADNGTEWFNLLQQRAGNPPYETRDPREAGLGGAWFNQLAARGQPNLGGNLLSPPQQRAPSPADPGLYQGGYAIGGYQTDPAVAAALGPSAIPAAPAAPGPMPTTQGALPLEGGSGGQPPAYPATYSFPPGGNQATMFGVGQNLPLSVKQEDGTAFTVGASDAGPEQLNLPLGLQGPQGPPPAPMGGTPRPVRSDQRRVTYSDEPLGSRWFRDRAGQQPLETSPIYPQGNAQPELPLKGGKNERPTSVQYALPDTPNLQEVQANGSTDPDVLDAAVGEAVATSLITRFGGRMTEERYREVWNRVLGEIDRRVQLADDEALTAESGRSPGRYDRRLVQAVKQLAQDKGYRSIKIGVNEGGLGKGRVSSREVALADVLDDVYRQLTGDPLEKSNQVSLPGSLARRGEAPGGDRQVGRQSGSLIDEATEVSPLGRNQQARLEAATDRSYGDLVQDLNRTIGGKDGTRLVTQPKFRNTLRQMLQTALKVLSDQDDVISAELAAEEDAIREAMTARREDKSLSRTEKEKLNAADEARRNELSVNAMGERGKREAMAKRVSQALQVLRDIQDRKTPVKQGTAQFAKALANVSAVLSETVGPKTVSQLLEQGGEGSKDLGQLIDQLTQRAKRVNPETQPSSVPGEDKGAKLNLDPDRRVRDKLKAKADRAAQEAKLFPISAKAEAIVNKKYAERKAARLEKQRAKQDERLQAGAKARLDEQKARAASLPEPKAVAEARAKQAEEEAREAAQEAKTETKAEKVKRTSRKRSAPKPKPEPVIAPVATPVATPAASNDQIHAAGMAALDELYAELPKTPAAPKAAKVVATSRRRSETAAASSLKSAGRKLTRSADKLATGLFKSFGGGGSTLGSGPVFTEEGYRAALPYFREAWADFTSAGQDLKEFFKAVLRAVVRGGASRDEVERVYLPAVERFVREVQDGTLPPEPEKVTPEQKAKREKVAETAEARTTRVARKEVGKLYVQFMATGDQSFYNRAVDLSGKIGLTDEERTTLFEVAQKEAERGGVRAAKGRDAAGGEGSAGRDGRAAAAADAGGAGAGTDARRVGGRAQRDQAQRGSADPAAARGTGVGGQPDLRVLDEAGLPGYRTHVGDRQYVRRDQQGAVTGGPDALQREGINRALSRFLDDSGKPRPASPEKPIAFMLADGVGVGKTNQLLVTAVEMAKRTGQPSLLVTENQILADSLYLTALTQLDIKLAGHPVTVVTYDNLVGKNPRQDVLDATWGTILFDEAHNLKNLGSSTAQTARGLKGSYRLLATGTPMDKTSGGSYFLAILTGRPEDAIQRELGYMVRVDPETGEPEIMPLPGFSLDTVLDNLKRMRGQMIREGAMLRRERPFWGTIGSVNVEASPQLKDELAQITAFMANDLKRFKPGRSRYQAKGRQALEWNRWLEPFKVPGALDVMERKLSQGRQVIIVAETVKQVTMTSLGGEVRPGSISRLADELDQRGIRYARVYGDRNKTPEVAAFQSGQTKVLLMTPQSGGTGIDLDDQVGGAPRTMLILSRNYSGNATEQMLGRISRRNSKSPAEVLYLDMPEVPYEADRARKSEAKLRILRAVQAGEDPDIAAIRYGVSDEVATGVATRSLLRRLPLGKLENYGGRLGRRIAGEVRGGQTSLRPMLNILADELPNTQGREISRRLANLVEDVPVVSESSELGLPYAHYAGLAETGSPRPFVMVNLSEPLEVIGNALLHEAVHIATVEAIVQLERTPQDPRYQALESLLYEWRHALYKIVQDGVVPDEITAYSTTNEKELLAVLMSDPRAQALARTIPLRAETARRITGAYRPTTLWEAFKQWVRRVLGLPEQDGNFLDTVIEVGMGLAEMRVPATVQEESFHRAGLPKTVASTLASTSNTLQDKTGIDLANLTDDAKSMLLGTMTLRQLGEQYMGVFGDGGSNPMADLIRATHEQQGSMHESLEYASEIYGRWEKLARSDPKEIERLHKLMRSATMWQFHPDRAQADPSNAHLGKRGGTMEAFRRGAREWGRLSPAAQRVFKEARDYYKAQHTRQTRMILENILRAFHSRDGTDLAAVSVRAVAEADSLMKATNKKEVEAAIAALQVGGTTKRLLAKVVPLKMIPGPYFPLQRRGDHVVVADIEVVEEFRTQAEADEFVFENPGMRNLVINDTVKPGRFVLTGHQRHVTFHESISEAERMAAELRQNPKATVRGPLRKRQFDGEPNQLSHTLVNEIVADVMKSGRVSKHQAESLETALREAMIRLQPETYVQKSLLHRSGIYGASEDMLRSFATYSVASARYVSHLQHSVPISRALEEMREVADGYGKSDKKGDADKQRLAQRLINELSTRQRLDAEVGEMPELVRSATEVGFAWYLLSPSYWLLNATQPLTIGLPLLGAEHGNVKAWSAMKRALRAVGATNVVGRSAKSFLAGLKGDLGAQDFQLVGQVMQAVSRSDHPLRNELKTMLEAVGREGLIDLSFSMQLAAGARQGIQGGNKIQTWIEYARDMTAIIPHAIEIVNRSTMAIAAYELARKQGLDPGKAIDKAKAAVAASQFDYSVPNKARYLKQWPLLKPVLMFKEYAVNLYYLMISNTAKAMQGASKEERAQARKALAGLLVSHGLVAGALGMVFEPLKIGIALASLAFGDDDPWDFEEDARAVIAELFGPEVGEVVARGLPRAVGVDLSSRVGLSSLLVMEGPGGTKPADMYEWIGRTLGGPLGGIGANWLDSYNAYQEGDWKRAVEKVLPKIGRDVVGAYRLGSEGLTDRNGITIRDAGQLSGWELAMKFMGFQPGSVAETYERRGAVMGMEQRGLSRRQTLLERYWRAESEPGKRQAIWDEIRRFNREYPAYAVTYGSLIRSMRSREQREKLTQQNGAAYLPATRQRFDETGSIYAN